LHDLFALSSKNPQVSSAVEQKALEASCGREKAFSILLDIWGLILGMLATFSYAQVAMYVVGL